MASKKLSELKAPAPLNTSVAPMARLHAAIVHFIDTGSALPPKHQHQNDRKRSALPKAERRVKSRHQPQAAEQFEGAEQDQASVERNEGIAAARRSGPSGKAPGIADWNLFAISVPAPLDRAWPARK
jgi:hypothetical protein